MTYLSFARKYRPGTFSEIVGQKHVATTLLNAISTNRVAHAYLFTGPRGVGKTSTARILAKSLNCEKGPTPSPCGNCPSCSEIARGSGMDVLEIDGASNRGIDEIRNLRESIKFAPLKGKFRIYIIDEVHMLTQEAFNALLKTLEEPPSHVKFIFATTRPYKVLPTIVSRCQRFDFRKIPPQDIVGKLKEIREKEKLDVEDEALFLIARSSDGSLRDSEVILDQLLSFAKGAITSADVVKVLGLLEEDALFEIAEAILKNEKNKLLQLVDALIAGGKDPIFVTTNIVRHFRNLLVVGVSKEKGAPFVALSEESYRRLSVQAGLISTDEALYIIYTLSAAMDLIKKTSLGQIPLEIALIKLTERRKVDSIREILERLSLLEKASPVSEPEEAPAEEVKEPTKTSIVSPNEIMVERDILLFQKIKTSWNKILNLIKAKKMSIATFLAQGTLIRINDDMLMFGFDESNILHKEALEENTSKGIVQEAIENVTGERIRFCVETLDRNAAQETPPMPADIEENTSGEGASNEPNRIDPIVESALDIFDGKVTDIRGKKAGGLI